MLNDIFKPVQKVTPEVIKALTKVNGLYASFYDRLPKTAYTSARGDLSGNSKQYSTVPTIDKEAILVYTPIQQTYAGPSDQSEFDAYMKEDWYAILHNMQLDVKLHQKVELHYGDGKRYAQIFKITTEDGVAIDDAEAKGQPTLIKYVYFSPLV